MENFTPVSALVGGAFIGCAAVFLLIFLGRVAGISGIISQAFSTQSNWLQRNTWRVAFVLGLIMGPIVAVNYFAITPPQAPAGNIITLVIAGLLVGFGAVYGSGCTSGHGVCGISRFSKRSIIATATFMATAGMTVWVMA
ncbi:transporter component [Catenovulum agarivorans DS-2]|uniref:Transporter component n=1 Tax=Catenovulum agarivorans DS-2 TaxID=1328313 RepID=W7R295_9ALTE|nr:YeeE/YedE family protein [Catenovulum agarivorans]EWH11750.1 transporter component [Catenovulum agarivorans DS-2]